MWRGKLGEDLTSYFAELTATPTPKRRGPHTELSDAQLHNRREQLVQAFEGAWGEIGWELRRCKKAGYSIGALQSMNVLHELGHAAAYNGHPSAIVNDQDNSEQSMMNQDTIEQNCF